MRKPKARKLPKKPKASASLAVLQNYLKRVADVKKHNASRMSDYNKAKSLHEKIKRM